MNTTRMPEPTFGEWLDDQLKERRWSRPRLARLIDYSPAAVSAWVRGVRLPEERACIAIAEVFGIDAEEVLERADRPTTGLATIEQGQTATADATLRKGPGGQSTDDPLTNSQQPRDDTFTQFLSRIESEVSQIAAGLRRAGLIPTEIEVATDAVRVPVIGRVPADSLRWTAGVEEEDVEITRAEAGDARAPFGLVVSGDCLLALGIYSGDVVICDRALGREPRDRQLVVVRIAGDVTLKRWCVTDNGVELRDGDETVVHRVAAGDDVEIIGFYMTYKPIAPR